MKKKLTVKTFCRFCTTSFLLGFFFCLHKATFVQVISDSEKKEPTFSYSIQQNWHFYFQCFATVKPPNFCILIWRKKSSNSEVELFGSFLQVDTHALQFYAYRCVCVCVCVCVCKPAVYLWPQSFLLTFPTYMHILTLRRLPVWQKQSTPGCLQRTLVKLCNGSDARRLCKCTADSCILGSAPSVFVCLPRKGGCSRHLFRAPPTHRYEQPRVGVLQETTRRRRMGSVLAESEAPTERRVRAHTPAKNKNK